MSKRTGVYATEIEMDALKKILKTPGAWTPAGYDCQLVQIEDEFDKQVQDFAVQHGLPFDWGQRYQITADGEFIKEVTHAFTRNVCNTVSRKDRRNSVAGDSCGRP